MTATTGPGPSAPDPAGVPDPGTAAFDALPRERAAELLLTCCSAPRWARRVATRGPHGDLGALLRACDEELARTGEDDVDAALAGHPRIGERSASAASSREQAAALAADGDVLAALAEGNRAYEERFGHVYLVCASGRSAEDLLATLRARLGNDPATERAVLRGELAAITRLRVRRLVADLAAGDPVAGGGG
ncbi:2-oxo-4-hydroxy-4-carboxy-5-ureidoimidazoline decarboxylase [Kineococcus gypseus]|uniref:2-oxo-4-hydroxy-4-carboxy-5-ureidoimidazoline decarboxylase n=1 Tax=Kineococcus gypseus TaxID=1637102 RepID=UPI003D7F0869